MTWEVRIEKFYKGPNALPRATVLSKWCRTHKIALKVYEDYSILIDTFHRDSDEYPNMLDFSYHITIHKVIPLNVFE